MSAIASITPQTAPRDFEGLKKTGIFQLRTLTERLGGLNDENQKMAYARMTLDDKVNLALQLLQQFDRANPGAAQAPAPYANGAPPPMASTQMPFNGTPVGSLPGPQQAPPPQFAPQQAAPQQFQPQFAPQPQQASAFGGFPSVTPALGGFAPPGFAPNGAGSFAPPGQPPMQQQALPMGVPQVASVDPAALASAQAAASGGAPAASGRKPRNSTKSDDSSDLGEKVLNALTALAQQSQANIEATANAMRDLGGAFDALQKDSPKEQLKQLHEVYNGLYNVLSAWDGRITQLQNTSNLQLALILMMAQQQFQNAPQEQILQHAIGQIGPITQILQGAPGKG